ncbi:Flp family type IVb pilin [Erythrobacter sp. SCSIO 43205]|uniref:Flp family type IVb pilin n=1 Tax=Erythrobacter sp. SCSIO 43205 TaxID=2779361 RepID=UPI001CA7C39F|nr:Flp family type IVb pilin [Erythrobacter sp. SCSIO 43205]UAB77681.1 Flp family type IVb pilin [Erythrobacter sp. SCSIO 43205]
MTHQLLAKLKAAPRTLSYLLRDQRGATAIEYGLLAALVGIVAMQALSSLGNATGQTFSAIDEAMGKEEEGEFINLSPPAP